MKQSSYDLLHRSLPDDEIAFLNFGYEVEGADDPRPHGLRLVLELLRDADLRDRDLLDVGCGRGGLLKTAREVGARVTGLDLNPHAVEHCHKQGIHVEQGDAHRMPFPDASFDVVTSLESAHSYAERPDFYAEVARVLRPRGLFLYGDLFVARKLPATLQALEGAGLRVESDRDVTPHVLLSRDRHARARWEQMPHDELAVMLAVPGTPYYEQLKDGTLTYRLLRCEKR